MSTIINGITYTIVSGFASVTASSAGITTANIESTVLINGTNYTVTTIGVTAFNSRSTLTSVTIPNSVTTINDVAFGSCTGLTSFTIPSSVTNLGNSVFSTCTGLTSITIPDTVTSFGVGMFINCSNLISVTLPNNLTSIKENMFNGCTSLTSCTVPNNVISIGSHAFRTCRALASVNLPTGLISIGLYAFHECNSLTSITIPNTVTAISGFAFRYSGLTSITINVATIAASTFELCTSLTSVTIGNNTTFITGNAFKNCTSLTSINIPQNVITISNNVFQNCSSLTSVNIESSTSAGGIITNSSIGQSCFENCTSLSSITIPNSVTFIGINAFKDCTSLISVIINNPANISSVSANSFTDVSSNINSSITFYNTGSFDNLSATWQTISNYYYTKLYDIQAKPSISFSLPTDQSFGSTTQIAPSYITSNSSGSFSYSSSNTSVATISGNTITFLAPGTSTITVTQEASGTYLSGMQQRTVIVRKATPTLSNFAIPTKTFGDDPYVITDPSSNSSGSFSYSLSNSSVATVSGNTITIIGAGSSAITVTQAETTNYLSITFTVANFVVINKASPTITNFYIPTKSFRNKPFAITNPSSNSSGSFSYSSSNTSVATISGNIITIVSAGSSTITVTQSATTNYLSKTATEIFVVNEGISIMNFYLSQLDVSVNSSSATLSSELQEVFFGDATVAVDIPLVNAMNIFQFSSDSTDINDVTANGLKYKVVYNGSGNTNLVFNIDTLGSVISGHIDVVAANNNATYDYVRYLALKLFNTHLGVDLFVNESELRTTLRDIFSTSFNSNMSVLHAMSATDASGNNPSKTIMNQIIYNQPTRLNNISQLTLGNNWFKCPFVIGDVLYFRLTVCAAANQHTMTNVVSIPDRVYLIKASLTA